MKTKYAQSARTTYSNSVESDAQPEVWHTVKFNDDSEIQIMATDPLDAIQKANANERRRLASVEK